MTHPASLFLALRDAGFSARTKDGKLLIAPVADLKGDLRELVITHRLDLVAWLEAAADDNARAAALAAIEPPGLADSLCVLQTHTLLRLHEDGEPPQYLAVHPDWLAAIRDFAAVARAEREAKDAKQAETRRKKEKAGQKKDKPKENLL